MTLAGDHPGQVVQTDGDVQRAVSTSVNGRSTTLDLDGFPIHLNLTHLHLRHSQFSDADGDIVARTLARMLPSLGTITHLVSTLTPLHAPQRAKRMAELRGQPWNGSVSSSLNCYTTQVAWKELFGLVEEHRQGQLA